MIGNIEDEFFDKKILVTGGAGSIGSILVKTLLNFSPKTIRILDNNETGLFNLHESLNKSEIIRLFIGDVRDKERLFIAMEGVDIVFHTAALKHVPLCEYNPFEAIKTNILGTQNVIDAAFTNGVDKVVIISTDKAISPVNVMGATKLLAEKLAIAANFNKGYKKTKFSCVRFGNVLGSRGSVLPLFLESIEKNSSIGITDVNMTRFIMKIEQAVELVLKTVKFMRGGEIFVLKMPSISIIEFADSIINLYVNKHNISKESIKINIIGKREGERMHEFLISHDELENSAIYELDDVYVLITNFEYYKLKGNLTEKYEMKKILDFESAFSSETCKKLNKEELGVLLKEYL